MAFAGIVGAIQKIVGGVAGTAMTGVGLRDLKRAKKEREKAADFWEQNKYEVPEAAQASLGIGERQAGSYRLPAEDLQRARLAETTSAGVGQARTAAQSSGDVMSFLGDIYGQQQRGEQNIAMSGAERYDRQQSALQQELGRYAGYQEEEFRFNKLLPYMQMLDRAEALGTRGAKYIGQGVSTMSGVGSSAMSEYGSKMDYNQFMEGIMSKDNQQSVNQQQVNEQYSDANMQQKPYY